MEISARLAQNILHLTISENTAVMPTTTLSAIKPTSRPGNHTATNAWGGEIEIKREKDKDKEKDKDRSTIK